MQVENAGALRAKLLSEGLEEVQQKILRGYLADVYRRAGEFAWTVRSTAQLLLRLRAE
jgi:hypothetical protein